MIHSIYIINKAGGKNKRLKTGLIYQKDYTDATKKLSTNDFLILAGTFHGMYAIASRVSPVPNSSGIKMLEGDGLNIHCFQTPTSIKFLIITDPGMTFVDVLEKRVYEVYADFCMKNRLS